MPLTTISPSTIVPKNYNISIDRVNSPDQEITTNLTEPNQPRLHIAINNPTRVNYCDKPLKINSEIQVMTPLDLSNRFGFIYTESIYIEDRSIQPLMELGRGMSTRLPNNNIFTIPQLSNFIQSSASKLVICKMGSVGHGVFAMVAIPKDYILGLYAGVIENNPNKKSEYSFALGNGIKLNATEYGNITRFIQHMPTKEILSKQYTMKEEVAEKVATANVECRSIKLNDDTFVKAFITSRDIEQNEQLGICYSLEQDHLIWTEIFNKTTYQIIPFFNYVREKVRYSIPAMDLYNKALHFLKQESPQYLKAIVCGKAAFNGFILEMLEKNQNQEKVFKINQEKIFKCLSTLASIYREYAVYQQRAGIDLAEEYWDLSFSCCERAIHLHRNFYNGEETDNSLYINKYKRCIKEYLDYNPLNVIRYELLCFRAYTKSGEPNESELFISTIISNYLISLLSDNLNRLEYKIFLAINYSNSALCSKFRNNIDIYETMMIKLENIFIEITESLTNRSQNLEEVYRICDRYTCCLKFYSSSLTHSQQIKNFLLDTKCKFELICKQINPIVPHKSDAKNI